MLAGMTDFLTALNLDLSKLKLNNMYMYCRIFFIEKELCFFD